PPGSGALRGTHEKGHGDLDGGNRVEPVARRPAVVGKRHLRNAGRDRRAGIRLVHVRRHLRAGGDQMFRALMKRIRNGRDRDQLILELDSSPQNEAELLVRLRELGLPSRFERVRLTRNRTVMVSFSGRDLRVHEGYLSAPRHVHAAMVTFVSGRTRAERRAAREAILAEPVERTGPTRRAPRTRPEDAWLVEELQQWHRRYNARHFEGLLRPVTIRVSRRMQSRLGHYTAALPRGQRA